MEIKEIIEVLCNKYKQYARMKYKTEANKENKFSGDHWMIGSYGQSTEDNKFYFVSTDHIHASELVGDAKTDSELIVELLNLFCSGKLAIFLDEHEALKIKHSKLITETIILRLESEALKKENEELKSVDDCVRYCREIKALKFENKELNQMVSDYKEDTKNFQQELKELKKEKEQLHKLNNEINDNAIKGFNKYEQRLKELKVGLLGEDEIDEIVWDIIEVFLDKHMGLTVNGREEIREILIGVEKKLASALAGKIPKPVCDKKEIKKPVMERDLISVGYYKGEVDFGVNCSIAELSIEELKKIREMIIVAIWCAEDMWRRKHTK